MSRSSGLCEQLEDFAQSHETHLWRVVEDFRAYCSEMNLLPDRRKWLRIVPCGTTFNLNVKWDVYYQPTERSYSPHEYLGIYNQKTVQYVGRVAAIYDNDQVNGAMVLKLVDGTGKPEFEQRITSMVQDTKAPGRLGCGQRRHPIFLRGEVRPYTLCKNVVWRHHGTAFLGHHQAREAGGNGCRDGRCPASRDMGVKLKGRSFEGAAQWLFAKCRH